MNLTKLQLFALEELLKYGNQKKNELINIYEIKI